MVAKSKNTQESVAQRLGLVIKSGKYTLASETEVLERRAQEKLRRQRASESRAAANNANGGKKGRPELEHLEAMIQSEEYDYEALRQGHRLLGTYELAEKKVVFPLPKMQMIDYPEGDFSEQFVCMI